MSLTTGTAVGPYEITGLLGAGGMGEVYRARDPRLNRDVAIKVLPVALADDSERLARFEREAQVLAALNHPNIAVIHGLEECPAEAGRHRRALVLELVEGETLEDRIARGPLPLDEALAVARQMADALEAAHEAGVVHRDLKPANVKITPAGLVKVLDFGLAKMREPAVGSPAHSQAPTLTSPATKTGVGVILGTAAYMSPEQARGKPVDRRTDIWAFGCILYEMLTGQRAFADEDVSLMLSKVLQREPDFDALPTATPACIRQTLRLCFKKDPRDRIQAIGDGRLALAGAFEHIPDRSAIAIRSDRWRRPIAMAASALVLGAILAGTAVWFATRAAPPLPVRTEIVTSGGAALSMTGAERDLAITPDGGRIVYRAAGGLFIRALDQLEPVGPIGGVEDARSIFVSPDGQSIGFFGNNSLNTIAVTGGPRLTLATFVASNAPRGATWGPDGTIVFATAAGTGLHRVSAQGGEVSVLTTPDRTRGEADHVWPEFLPDGQAVLYTILPTTGGLDNAQIALLDLRTSSQTVLVRGGHHAHFVGTEHLVYGTGNTLSAVSFDLARRTATGAPVPVLEQVLATPYGAVGAAVAENGTLAYVSGTSGLAKRRIVWVNRDGSSEPIPAIDADDYRNVRLSPDGRTAMVALNGDLWIYELTSGRRTRLTRDGSAGSPMAWHPNGSRIAFTSRRGGNAALNAWVQAADGSDSPRQVTNLEGTVDVDEWSPDGRVLAVHHHRPDGGQSMLMLRMDTADATAEPFVEDEPWAEGATFSPDGRYVAYTADEDGQREVYIRAYPRAGGRIPVSVGGGQQVMWAPTGEIFYRNDAGDRLMVVSVTTKPTLRVGVPREVLNTPFSVNPGLAPRPLYDVTADGRRFLTMQDAADGSEKPSVPRLIVVQHWLEELKRLVPVN